MSASYTPGPWFRDPYGNICDARGKTVEANGLASLCSPEGEHGDVMRANARLISAAPDLVEALKKADRAIQAAYAQSDAEWRNHDKIAEKHCAVVREGTDAIRTALSKALGEGEGM